MRQGSETSAYGFLGGGNIARALIGGLRAQGVAAEAIRVGEPSAARCTELGRDFGVRAGPDNATAVRGADVVVLAVKPEQAGAVLRAQAAALAETRPLLLSIAAGVRLETLRRVCPPGVPLLRGMPNRPALIGAGITALYAPPELEPAHRALAERIARATGRVVWLPEERQLDLVTALSGSGPAYFLLLAELLAQAGERLGLEARTASLLAAETLYGSGMLAKGGESLAAERAAVTSKGGTTEAAVRVLLDGGLPSLVSSALSAAAARAAEIGAEHGARKV